MCCIPIHLPSFLSDAEMMLSMNKKASHVMFPGVTLPTTPLFPQAVGYETALNCPPQLQQSPSAPCFELRLVMQWPQHSQNLMLLPMPVPHNITFYLMRLHTGLSLSSLNLVQAICPCQSSILTGLYLYMYELFFFQIKKNYKN